MFLPLGMWRKKPGPTAGSYCKVWVCCWSRPAARLNLSTDFLGSRQETDKRHQGWICHPAHQGDLGWMGHYQLSKQSIQGLINWTPILQSAANVVKTEYSTFTYFITSLSNGQTVTATDIVVSSKVVTTCSIRPWQWLDWNSSTCVSSVFGRD